MSRSTTGKVLRNLPIGVSGVIDSGLFHIYSGQDQAQERTRYVQGLAHVLKTGDRLFLLSFTDEAPEGGVSKQELV